jgi:hypothetical protein
MTTFSQLIDDTVVELVRPDLDTFLPAYLNQTIREFHTFSRDGTPVLFDDNRQEESVMLSQMESSGWKYNWQIPNLARFQYMDTVWYSGIGQYAREKNPRIALARTLDGVNETIYWYRSGPFIVFSNPGFDGQEVKISWFEYPRSLIYYPNGTSPILYDRENDSYVENPKYTGPALTYEQKMERSTNWILQRHEDACWEGLRAKSWKRADDQNRSKLSYSTFETMKLAIQQGAQAKYVARFGS